MALPSALTPTCTAKNSWSGSKGRAYIPPLECGGFDPLPAKRAPFCAGIVVDEGPFTPGGSAGRVLNSFNWTLGRTRE